MLVALAADTYIRHFEDEHAPAADPRPRAYEPADVVDGVCQRCGFRLRACPSCTWPACRCRSTSIAGGFRHYEPEVRRRG